MATVTLDAKALDELGPHTLDRLADLVAKRLAAREAAGQVPLLTIADAAKVAKLSDSTIRRAIRLGELTVAGYVGKRARLRRSDVEAWLADGSPPARVTTSGTTAPPRRRARESRSHVLGDALIALAQGGGSR